MKVVPIIGRAPTSSACSEGSGTVPRLDLPLTRREFLQGSGVLTGTLAAGSVLVTLAPSRSWAVELKTLSSAEGETLMKMGRVLYPHPKLPDAVYALLLFCYRYDPATGKSSPVGSMGVPRNDPTATLLDDGRVLIAGGENEGPEGWVSVPSAVLYQP
mgnify:CR=1 FL=1